MRTEGEIRERLKTIKDVLQACQKLMINDSIFTAMCCTLEWVLENPS